MNPKDLLNKYYANLRTESLIKSLIAALLVGFSALAISSLICWLTGFKAVWIVAILFVVAAGASFPLFYFVVFHVDEKKAAQRADAYGLEERILTMTELEGDQSYIAERQRTDALAAFAAISEKATKIAVPVALVIATAVVACVSIAPTTMAGLSAAGKAPSGSSFIDQIVNGGGYDDTFNELEFELTFVTNMCGQEDEGGYLEGDIVQFLTRADEATTVVAEADEGYVFAGWYDNLDWAVMNQGNVMVGNGWVDTSKTFLIADEEAYRLALVSSNPDFTPDMKKVTGDTVYYALFMVPPGGTEYGENGDPSDKDAPPPPPNDKSDNNDGSGEGEGSNGTYEGNSQVIDGETYYGDAMTGGEGGSGVPGDYFGTIGN